MAGCDIAHGDGRADTGGKAARCDSANLQFACKNRRAFAYRHLALDRKADQLARRALSQRFQDAICAVETAFLAAALRNGKAGIALNRISRRVHVVAIERKPRLQPQ